MDWHRTQNQEYLSLLQTRLQDPLLMWVEQFVEIINSWITENPTHTKVSINDYGCNVGHFCRGLEKINVPVDYVGYDISETYLKIAREHFKEATFFNLDVSGAPHLRSANISIISATLEHILDHSSALKNIFDTSQHLVILRTFVGDKYVCDDCHTDGASSKYLIKQFSIDDLVAYPKSIGWHAQTIVDHATGGKPKFVCNGRSIIRSQKIIVFTRS